MALKNVQVTLCSYFRCETRDTEGNFTGVSIFNYKQILICARIARFAGSLSPKLNTEFVSNFGKLDNFKVFFSILKLLIKFSTFSHISDGKKNFCRIYADFMQKVKGYRLIFLLTF